MKTERTQIHFLSDVLVAVASLVLKVPIASGDLGAMYPVYIPLCLNVQVFHARKNTSLYFLPCCFKERLLPVFYTLIKLLNYHLKTVYLNPLTNVGVESEPL